MSDITYTPAAPGDFFCPAGGTWYACQTGSKFVGCCTSDPCGIGCFGDRLRPAGVSTSIYNQYPGGTCGGSTDFWTCLNGPTFWGCCNSDPCKNNGSCAVGDLEPAIISRDDQMDYFRALNLLLSSTVVVSSSATSSSSISITASASPTSSSSGSSSKVSGAVVGGIVAGIAALLIIIGAIIFFLCRRRRRKQKVSAEEASTKDAPVEMPSPQYNGYTPPPTYLYEDQAYSQVPQELPAKSAVKRYSELPGQNRISELPAGATEPRELESPEVSPRPAQEPFPINEATQPPQGLGLKDAGEDVKR